MNISTVIFLLEDRSLVNVLYGACVGLVGAVVALFLKLDKKNTDYQTSILAERDKVDVKQDQEKEKYENMLEKVLNAFSSMDKTLLENSSNLPETVTNSIKAEHELLRNEITQALSSCKRK
jgi:gas vesicle protein